MSLVIGENFSYQGQKPNFVRDTFTTLDEMKNYPTTSLDEGHVSLCLETKLRYEFYSTNSVNPETGRWRRIVDTELDANSENPLSNKALSKKFKEEETNANSELIKVANEIKKLIDVTNKNVSDNELTTAAALNEFRTIFDDGSKIVAAAINDLNVNKVSSDATINGHEFTEKDIILTKSDIGLGNVDNTSDASKPVSSPQQAALNRKVDKKDNYSLIGKGDLLKLQALPDNTTLTGRFNDVSNLINDHKKDKNNPHSVTAAQVGLGSYSGTTPKTLPISKDQQDALDLKVNLSRKIITEDGEYTLENDVTLNKTSVGLSRVDNTNDKEKPISNAQQLEFNKIYGVMYNQHAEVSISSSVSIIEKDVSKAVTIKWDYKFNGVSETPYTLKLQKNDVDVVRNPRTLTFSDSISTTTRYKVVSVNRGVEKSKEITIGAYYPKYYGSSSLTKLTSGLDVTRLGKQLITSSARGTYKFPVGASEYVWFCVPPGMEIKGVTSSGFSVPIEAPIEIAVSGKGSYKCYRSSKSFEAGTFECYIS